MLQVRADRESRSAPGAVHARGHGRAPWSGLPAAVAFLTIVPVPGSALGAGLGLGAAAGWFPLVGAAIGAVAGAVRVGAQQLLGSAPATVLAMIALVVLTGALHQDGLADSADGLGVRGDRGRRLEAMRDSSTGAFGVLALIGWALLLFATLASLGATDALTALAVACGLARWAALVHAVATPAARTDGLGASLRVSRAALALATGLAIALALALCGLAAGAVAMAAALLLAVLSALFARRTLGGHTGDTLGATVAVTEVIVCTALLALWRG